MAQIYLIPLIEYFHSRGQHLCKFIGTKESVCIRKEFNSQRIGLGHQHGHCFIVLGHPHGRRDVMWKHSILNQIQKNLKCPLLIGQKVFPSTDSVVPLFFALPLPLPDLLFRTLCLFKGVQVAIYRYVSQLGFVDFFLKCFLNWVTSVLDCLYQYICFYWTWSGNITLSY